MGARLRAIREKLLRRVNYKVTRGGLLYTLLLLLTAAFAVASANNLFFLIVAMMLSAMLVSGLIGRLCLAGLELDVIVPEHVSACRTVQAKLYVRNLKSWMPSFSIHVANLEDHNPPVLSSAIYFPVIPGGALLEETIGVRFARRGAHRQNSFAFSTKFPFGFLEKRARVMLRREVIVYPSIDPQPGFEDLLAGLAGDIETHYKGLGKDFYRIRPYEALESARHVDWKATAHTGAMQVREFAREQERTVEIYLDREVPEHLDDWFERAVHCCAFLVWRLSEEGAGLRFRAQGFHLRVPEEGDIYTILKFLALVYPQNGKPVEPPQDDHAFQIVFSAAPQRCAEAGWAQARVLAPDSFPDVITGAGTAAAAGEAGAGENVHHGR